jgi:hypothetical protein
VRQRGAQSRRGRPGDSGTFGAPLDTGGGGDRFWPTVALIAVVIATAGWTTVAILVATDRADQPSPAPSAIAAAPSDTAEPTDDESLEPDLGSPEPESHVSPALEALLPKSIDGASMSSQSSGGDTYLADDGWSIAMSTFLQGAGKTPADLLVAQSLDPSGTIDLYVSAYTISGISAAEVRKTLVNALKSDLPTLKTTTATVAGKKVTTGVVEGTQIYWYEHDAVVFEVTTSDAALATTALGALP